MSDTRMVFVPANSYVGAVKKEYAKGEYISPHNNEPVDAPVVEFHDGNCFIDQGNNVELTKHECELFVHFSKEMLLTVTKLVRSATVMETNHDLIFAMVRTAGSHHLHLLPGMWETTK